MHLLSPLSRTTAEAQKPTGNQTLDPLEICRPINEKSSKHKYGKFDRSHVEANNIPLRVDQAIQQARIYLCEKEFESAQLVLTKLIQSETHRIEDSSWRHEVMEMLATSYIELGQWDGLEKIGQEFIEENYDIDRFENELWRVFHTLAEVSFRNGKVTKAESWCRRAVYVARSRFSHQSLLFSSSVGLLTEILEKRGNQVEADDWKMVLRRDSIHDYVYRGAEREVKAILDKASCTDRDTALEVAVRQEKEQIVRLLLDKGANCETRGANGQPVLVGAAKKGSTRIVKLLLEKGAMVDAVSDFRETSLMLAVKNGHEETVLVLLEAGANVRLRNPYFQTPLELARRNGNTNIVRLLKKHKGKHYR